MKHQSLYMIIFFFFAAISVSFAQIPEENALILRSGHPYLYDIALLELGGKPRIGILHYDNNQYSKANLPESNFFYYGRTSTDVRTNLKMYFKLLEVQFLEEFFDQMQTEEPTAGTGNMSDMFKTMQGGPNQKSRFAQIHLMEVLKVLINDKGFNRYFCAEGSQCKKGLETLAVWGGTESDEFSQRSAFQNFVQETLPALLKWAEILDNRAIAVSSLPLFSKYDFEEEGFPIQISPKIHMNNINEIAYVPKLDFEQNATTSQRNFSALLKMSPEDARSLREKQDKDQRVYFTIEIEFHGISERTMYNLDDKYLEYHLVSPVVSFYLDPDLSEKIGEIVLE